MNAQAMQASLPIGYHAIHPNVSLNFQMNRWFGLVGGVSMLDEMRTVAPRIPAQNHCQAGNFGLALQVITAWLELTAARAQRS